MRPVRLGTHESEFLLADEESPLQISIVSPVGSGGVPDSKREYDLTLSWVRTTGRRVTECKKLIEAIDAMRSGKVLRFIDIRLDREVFSLNPSLLGDADPFEPSFRRLAFLASQIEQEYSIPLRMPDAISQEDDESLFYLDCLLNGRAYGRVENANVHLAKAGGEDGEAQEAFIKGESPATFTEAPSDYPGYFPLLGLRVATRDWVRVIEFEPAKGSVDLMAFSEAPIGCEFTFKITAKGPAYLRWRDESPLKNIEVAQLI